MSRVPFSFSVVMALFLSIFPAHALAQSPFERDAWLVTPALGLALDEDADPSLTLSGALGYGITRLLALEAELGHVFDLSPGDADVDSSLTTVHAALAYFFESEYELTPYLAGGLGVARFSHEVRQPPASIGGTEIGFNLGGGATYPVNERAWLRADFRYFKHIDDVPSVWRFAGGFTMRLGR